MKRLIALLLLLVNTPAVSAQEREITLRRDFGTLHGTLLVPVEGSETAVLFIAGSGPTDRNCNNALGVKTNAFLYLAQELEKTGIASLRYDKRAIGASALDDPAKISDLRFDDYIADAKALTAFLKAEGFRRIVLLGHSEGALIALCAAQNDPAVTAVVSVSGAAYPIDRLLENQLAAQLALADPTLMMEIRSVLTSLRQGKVTAQYPKELEILFAPHLQEYMLSQMRYDPCKLIANLGIPVLIVHGDNDLQVPADNADALAAARPGARKVIVGGMTHTLKMCNGRTQADQISAYTDSTLSLAPGFTEAVTDFIRSL